MCDAKTQAYRMVRQHDIATACRVAAEIAVQFGKKTKGRAFWCEVTEELNHLRGVADHINNPEERVNIYINIHLGATP